MSWVRPPIVGSVRPTPRCAHAATSNNTCLYLFGGWGSTKKFLDDFYIYHLEGGYWTKPTTTGTPPSARAGHTMTLVDNKIYLFGGGDERSYMNDLYIFDIDQLEWQQAYVKGLTPAARSRHTASRISSGILIFGGGDDGRTQNDLFLLDLVVMEWKNIKLDGPSPSPRWGHSVSPASDQNLIFFGGHSGTDMLQDLWMLNTEDFIWQQLKPNGAIGVSDSQPPTYPSKRAGHVSAPIGRRIFFFGGGDGVGNVFNDVWILDMTSPDMHWSNPTLSGNAPTPRGAHTINVIGSKLIMFGGGDQQKRKVDTYILDIEEVNNRIVEGKARRKRITSRSRSEIPDVAAWLNDNGMRQYTDRFQAEEITIDTLPLLTEEHLKDMGVTPLGHRLRLLSSIKTLEEKGGREKTEATNQMKHLSESVRNLTLQTSELNRSLSTLHGDLSRLFTEEQLAVGSPPARGTPSRKSNWADEFNFTTLGNPRTSARSATIRPRCGGTLEIEGRKKESNAILFASNREGSHSLVFSSCCHSMMASATPLSFAKPQMATSESLQTNVSEELLTRLSEAEYENEARCTLHTWCAMHERAAELDVGLMLSDVAIEGIQIIRPFGEPSHSRDEVLERIRSLPSESQHAHHIVKLEVKRPNVGQKGKFRAEMLYQGRSEAGNVINGLLAYDVKTDIKSAAARITRISEIKVGLLEHPTTTEFKDNFCVNRVTSLVYYWACLLRLQATDPISGFFSTNTEPHLWHDGRTVSSLQLWTWYKRTQNLFAASAYGVEDLQIKETDSRKYATSFLITLEGVNRVTGRLESVRVRHQWILEENYSRWPTLKEWRSRTESSLGQTGATSKRKSDGSMSNPNKVACTEAATVMQSLNGTRS
ncbi:hypothetical protein PROFUN_04783 [Planoprotostelium fungivorum]|uniref:SAM domain-containing protein n=1 Tax=Planoprotostelium fungivorum TaxID=1890364 RepID=A0A2P6NSV9_9EUKA|nr:hypothetical protein PROFUN_04783 [Planoprotostelium fungivorum]